MSDYNKAREMFDELSRFCKKYNVTIVTATQPKRDVNLTDDMRNSITKHNDVLIIDHIGLVPDKRLLLMM